MKMAILGAGGIAEKMAATINYILAPHACQLGFILHRIKRRVPEYSNDWNEELRPYYIHLRIAMRLVLIETSLKERYEEKLRLKEDEIAYYKDFKARQSTIACRQLCCELLF